MKKGILGVRKDPSKPALFFFNVRRGEECASDPDDSDFEPLGLNNVSDDEPVDSNSDTSYHSVSQARRSRSKVQSEEVLSKRKPRNDARNQQHLRVSRGTKRKIVLSDSGDSDSDSTVIMSDYVPDDDTNNLEPSGKKQSRTLTKNTLSSISLSTKSSISISAQPYSIVFNSSRNDVDVWGQRVPEIVLLRIFEEVVRNDGALPFLSRVAPHVCRLWNSVSTDPVLWKNIDLSYGWIKKSIGTMNMLCETRFSCVEVLNLSGWKTSDADFVRVASSCPRLTSIKLEGCGLTANGLISIIDNAPNIVSFDLSGTSAVTIKKSMNYLFDNRGARLKSLTLDDCLISGCRDILNLIANKCPGLESLSIWNRIAYSCDLKFHVEEMQMGCTKLKSLRLVNARFSVNHATVVEQIQSPGFPCLEELRVSTSTPTESVILCNSDNFLHRMLKHSARLKTLDLRGIQNITCNSLQSLNIPDLQHLYIASSSVAKNEGLDVIMSKWQHSLVDVDLSWNVYPDNVLDEAMSKLSENSLKSELRSLDARGTQISPIGIRCLLNGCPRLEKLILDSCRVLPRGMKKEYSSRKQLKALLRDLNSII